MQEVRRLRQARGWNQTELAFHAGLAPSVISQIENGKRNPGARTLEKLASALDVRVGDLFPKGQPPLPFDEEAEQRRSPFLDSWTAYMLKRAREWERALPQSARDLDVEFVHVAFGGRSPWSEKALRGTRADLAAEMRADPQLALEVLRRCEPVQSEAAALIGAAIAARSDPSMPLRDADRPDANEFDEALDLVSAVSDRWCVAEQAARDIAGEGELRWAKLEQARDRAEERRNVVALFEGHRSA